MQEFVPGTFRMVGTEQDPFSVYSQSSPLGQNPMYNQYESQLQSDIEFLGLSEIALVAMVLIGDRRKADRARHTLRLRRAAQIATNMDLLPYTVPAIVL